MSTWILVWFIAALISTLALVACVAGLARHVLLLGRTARRAQEEIRPVVDAISREGEHATTTVANFQVPGRGARS